MKKELILGFTFLLLISSVSAVDIGPGVLINSTGLNTTVNFTTDMYSSKINTSTDIIVFHNFRDIKADNGVTCTILDKDSVFIALDLECLVVYLSEEICGSAVEGIDEFINMMPLIIIAFASFVALVIFIAYRQGYEFDNIDPKILIIGGLAIVITIIILVLGVEVINQMDCLAPD